MKIPHCAVQTGSGFAFFLFSQAVGSGQTAVIGACDELREVQLHIQFFNLTGALPVYALKILCMSLSVSNGCFAVKMIADHPVMAIFGAFVSIASSSIYAILYERAFFLSDGMKRAKQHLRQVIHRTGGIDSPTKSYLRKRVGSVPPVGIRLGNFGTFEREATPIFVDFVIRNIAGLLLSLRFSQGPR